MKIIQRKDEECRIKRKKPIQTEAWAAIRLDKNSGREWLDCDSVRFDRQKTVGRTKTIEYRIPYWVLDNPIVRIVEVTIKEKQGESKNEAAVVECQTRYERS